METCVAAHRDCLRSPSPSGTQPETTRPESGRLQDDCEPFGRRAERKKAAHALFALAVGGPLRARSGRRVSFWIAYILTRPPGASMGDYLPPIDGDGGLGLGTVVTSALFHMTIPPWSSTCR